MGRAHAARPRLARTAGILGAGLLRLLGATWRVRVAGRAGEIGLRAAGRPILYAFWHGHLLPLAFLMRNMDAYVLVSEHGDGEYITQVIRRLRFDTVRGSTTRGGYRALLALARLGREGRLIAITPDGPRGPRRQAQAGALVVAQRAGVPIVPVAIAAARAWQLASWDRFLIPRPFTRVVLGFGEPFVVPVDLAPAALVERCLPLLEAAMGTACAAAERGVAAWVGKDEADGFRPAS